MLEQIIFALLNEVVVPEISKFIKDKFESTGTWPTKEELKVKIDSLHAQIKLEGEAFLNRPK